MTDYLSLLQDQPSRYHYQCLEPVSLVVVHFDHIRKGYDRYPGFERNGRLIAEAILTRLQKRVEGFQFDSAEQRYLGFMNANPDLLNRISLTHLSSYLGIKRPSLSRIRAKLTRP